MFSKNSTIMKKPYLNTRFHVIKTCFTYLKNYLQENLFLPFFEFAFPILYQFEFLQMGSFRRLSLFSTNFLCRIVKYKIFLYAIIVVLLEKNGMKMKNVIFFLLGRLLETYNHFSFSMLNWLFVRSFH